MASAYERGPSHALTVRGHDMQQQVSLLVHYMGIEIEAADRIDLSVEAIQTVHRFQILI